MTLVNINLKGNHIKNEEGNITGGMTEGIGISIIWQPKPLGQGENKIEQTGAMVEDVIWCALDRLQAYQNTKCGSQFNIDAMEALHEALRHLNARTKKREDAGVEGTYEVEGAAQGHHKGCCKD